MKIRWLQLFIIGFFIFPNLNLISQNETSQWYFGNGAVLDFMSNPPSTLAVSSMTAPEGCSSIADANGNLLFYTNGVTVWNQNHAIMANGTGLDGNISVTQSALIVKQPGSANLYYLFTLGGIPTTTAGLRYSIIDMSLAAGMGSVTAKNTLIFNTNPLSEKLCATRHCNGIDIWIAVHDYYSADFRCYLLTSTGINSSIPVISSIGSVFNGNPINNSMAGQMKFSQNGKKIGFAKYGGVVIGQPDGAVELFDFNNSTGVITNSVWIAVGGAYGFEFSPDGTKSYASSTIPAFRILQWDLCAGSATAIVASQFTVAAGGYQKNSFQLASNGKLYIARAGGVQHYLSVIHNPNNSGSACNFSELGQYLGTKYSTLGLPNFVSSLVKTTLTYTQDISCMTVSFTPPSSTNTLGGCSATTNSVNSMQWNFGDPGSGPNNSSTLVTPTHVYPTIGSYNVKLVINYAYCAADTINQIIHLTNSSVTINSASVSCTGLATSTAIVLGTSGPFSYTWLPSFQSNSVATNLSPGIYTVSIKNIGGICVKTVTTHIIAPLQIVASFNSTSLSCTTASAQVSFSNGSGNYTYSWSPGGQTTPTVTGLNAGTYTVFFTDTLNNCSSSRTVQIILPVPSLSVSGNFTLCPGQSASLTVLGANTYTWNSGANTSTVVLSPTVNTTFTVSGTDTSSSCTSIKTVKIVVSKCLNVDNLNNEHEIVRIYPNPISDEFILETENPVRIIIYNQIGLPIYNSDIETKIQKINMSQFSSGIYFIEIRNANSIETKKIIKH